MKEPCDIQKSHNPGKREMGLYYQDDDRDRSRVMVSSGVRDFPVPAGAGQRGSIPRKGEPTCCMS